MNAPGRAFLLAATEPETAPTDPTLNRDNSKCERLCAPHMLLVSRPPVLIAEKDISLRHLSEIPLSILPPPGTLSFFREWLNHLGKQEQLRKLQTTSHGLQQTFWGLPGRPRTCRVKKLIRSYLLLTSGHKFRNSTLQLSSPCSPPLPVCPARIWGCLASTASTTVTSAPLDERGIIHVRWPQDTSQMQPLDPGKKNDLKAASKTKGDPGKPFMPEPQMLSHLPTVSEHLAGACAFPDSPSLAAVGRGFVWAWKGQATVGRERLAKGGEEKSVPDTTHFPSASRGAGEGSPAADPRTWLMSADSNPKELINRWAPYGEKPPERKPSKEKMESTVSECLGVMSTAEWVVWIGFKLIPTSRGSLAGQIP
ncbi:hypothetical protein PANDA_012820 [Ailuropoda melanoleuca]|uniref:Uncharacterized protein n=1 Tax=Ailuropoda melanoleuca TaxID=9646 RepID=D2HMJ7_AILME|nr:hypothetical protein PANDA_012820 [Ailuropoda melanoleuca]